jgi:hypothetical protein
MTPPPTTMSLSGTSGKERASVEVTTLSPSTWAQGGMRGAEPVAMRKKRAESSSPVSSTRTFLSERKRAVPRWRAMPFFLKRNSTPWVLAWTTLSLWAMRAFRSTSRPWTLAPRRPFFTS